MIVLLRHTLILTQAILLMLPVGFCCALPRLSLATTTPHTEAKPEACCPACNPPAPIDDSEEAPAPRAPSCCCGEQDRLANDSRLALAAPDLICALAACVILPESVLLPHDRLTEGPPPPKRPLHLLRCVWLC